MDSLSENCFRERIDIAFEAQFEENNTTAHDQANLCYLLYQSVLSQALGIELNDDNPNGTSVVINGRPVAMIRMVNEKGLGLCLDILIPSTEEASNTLFAQKAELIFDTWEDSTDVVLEEPDIEAYAAMAMSEEIDGANPSTSTYSDSVTVQRVQEALNNAGYDCGTPDGKAGDKTHAALNAYQEANGLTVQNDITDEVLTALGI